jgi:hypothetical protein
MGFRFSIDSMQIHNTRSRHEDTVWAVLTVDAAGHRSTVSRKLGDFNNGVYGVGVSLDLDLADDAPVSMAWSLVNAGHGSDADIQLALGRAGTAVIDDQTSGGGTEGGGGFWAAVAKVVMQVGLGFIFADCDGPLMADRLTGTAVSRLGHLTRRYPGVDSASGCGSNSDYTVTVSVTRI